MTSPTPALVAQRAAQRLPRVALLLFCAVYVLPGLIGRDPWRSADITAFGYMLNLARGVGDPFTPQIAGITTNGALLPYWLGAVSIRLLGGWLDPALAARVPFALLLIGVLVFTWYSTYHLARTEAALPLPFAFGGEAQPIDYARAIADGALLALMATLGLLQLGHETTPELVQLFASALFLYAMAASPWRRWQSRTAAIAALAILAASGAPTIGLALAAAGLALSVRSSYEAVRQFARWLLPAALLAVAIATALGAWSWRLEAPDDAWEAIRLLGWFAWPAWALAGWTLWRWRTHIRHRHIAVPAAMAAIALAACIGMKASDRALMLGLPALAVLAAFALPTLQRSVAAAIDWFSVAFFSAIAIAVWVIYASLQLGFPAKPAANIARLAPGYPGGFSLFALLIAIAGTVAWIALVRWRTGRHRTVLWKSLVLPAGGLTLCWLLLLSLTLPVLDYARSYRPLVERIAQHVPGDACVTAAGLPTAMLAALEYHGGWRVVVQSAPTPGSPQSLRGDAREPSAADRRERPSPPSPDAGLGCEFLLANARVGSAVSALTRPGWTLIARERRPTERDEQTLVYRRAAAAAS